MYSYGGGWALGSVRQEDTICQLLNISCNTRMISLEYRLASKHNPTLSMIFQCDSLGFDPIECCKVMLSEGRAGRDLAFAVASKLIDQGMEDNISGIAELFPAIIIRDDVPESLGVKST